MSAQKLLVMTYVTCSTCFLFYGGSTAQVRGNGFGMAHTPVLPFSFLRATHGRRNFKDTNPLISSLLVIFVWGGEAIL